MHVEQPVVQARVEVRVCGRPDEIHSGEMRRTDKLPPQSPLDRAREKRVYCDTHLDGHVDVLGFYAEMFFGSLNGVVHG